MLYQLRDQKGERILQETMNQSYTCYVFAMTHDILSCMCSTFEQVLTIIWLLSPKQVEVNTFFPLPYKLFSLV